MSATCKLIFNKKAHIGIKYNRWFFCVLGFLNYSLLDILKVVYMSQDELLEERPHTRIFEVSVYQVSLF